MFYQHNQSSTKTITAYAVVLCTPHFRVYCFLCPLRAQMENAMRFPLLCSRSAPKGGSTRNACGCFSKKQPNPPLSHTKKAHLAMCFFVGIVDSFNSAGLHLCNTPKRQHRKVVRHAMRVAVFSKKQPNPPLSPTKSTSCDVLFCWWRGVDSNHRSH